MKKSLLALAALTAFAGAASAQSSVTLFGGADLNYRSVSSGVNKFSGMAQDGIYSSRIGVMGVEDLGGGLKAGFHFEGGMNPDTGTPGGFNFLRKSTIGLMGGFGELRFGRDYTPTFTVHGVADPFGTNGVGSYLNVAGSTVLSDGTAIGAQTAQDTTGSFSTADRGTARRAATAPTLMAGARTDARWTLADPNAVRANNSVTYYSPSMGGFAFSFMYSFGGENTYSLKNTGKMTSVRLGYAAGPINVAYGRQSTDGGITAALGAVSVLTTTPTFAETVNTAGTDNQTWTTNVLAASYDLGVAKVSYMYRKDGLKGFAVPLSAKTNTLGVWVPMGATTLKGSYSKKKASADGDSAGTSQLAMGFVHDLSKRSSVYGTFSRIKNDAGLANSVGSAPANGGDTSRGFEVGVKHNF